jgi:hypothetical protein
MDLRSTRARMKIQFLPLTRGRLGGGSFGWVSILRAEIQRNLA